MEKKIKFEEALARLDKIVSDLESGNTSLDDSLTLFEEGIQLIKLCDTKLKNVEEKISEIINKPE